MLIPLACCASICADHSCSRTSCLSAASTVVFVSILNPPVSNLLQHAPWTNLECLILSMDLLRVYYTAFDTRTVDAEGLTVTYSPSATQKSDVFHYQKTSLHNDSKRMLRRLILYTFIRTPRLNSSGVVKVGTILCSASRAITSSFSLAASRSSRSSEANVFSSISICLPM